MMKKIINLVFSIILGLLPLTAFAHGGIEKSTAHTTVFLVQSPISPLVGETVRMNFVLAKKENVLERLKNFPVTLTLVDTFYGDESKDKTILTKNVTTDENGSFDFSYTFPKANYFDVELHFKDPVTGEDQTTGFLVQTRELAEQKNNIPLYICIGLGCITLGLALTLLFLKRRNLHQP